MVVKTFVSLVAGLAVTAVPLGGAQAQQVATAADDVPDIMAPYVIGQTVYDGGQPVAIDWGGNPPTAQANVGGYGRSSDGRLVVVVVEPDPEIRECHTISVRVVSASTPPVEVDSLHSCTFDDLFIDYGLSDSGDTVYGEAFDPWESSTEVAIFGLDGTQQAHRWFGDTSDVMDVDGNKVVVGDHGGSGSDRPGLYSWTVGTSARRIVTGTVEGADVGAGIQWRSVKDGYYVARTLTNPKDIRWKLRFEPLAVAADGRKILGYQTNAKGISTGVVQVRLARSGELVRSVRPGVAWDSYKTGWDGNNTIFTAREGGGQPWLMRCPMKKPCQRAQDISSYEDFEVFEHQ